LQLIKSVAFPAGSILIFRYTIVDSQCKFLERNDIPVSCVNVVWAWGNHEKAYGQEKQAELDKALAGQGVTFSRVVVDNN